MRPCNKEFVKETLEEAIKDLETHMRLHTLPEMLDYVTKNAYTKTTYRLIEEQRVKATV